MQIKHECFLNTCWVTEEGWWLLESVCRFVMLCWMQMGVSLPWGKGEHLDAEVMRVQGVLKVFVRRQTDTHTIFTLTQTCKVMLLPRFLYAYKRLYHSSAGLLNVMTSKYHINEGFLHCQVFIMSWFLIANSIVLYM